MSGIYQYSPKALTSIYQYLPVFTSIVEIFHDIPNYG